METEKRRASLADRFLAIRSLSLYPQKTTDSLKRSVRAARRFIFDDEAAMRLADVIYDVPDMLASQYQFARAPFDQTWIEFQGYPFFDRLKERAEADGGHYALRGSPETADAVIGYLIDHGSVSVFAAGTMVDPSSGVACTPIQYQLNTEWPLEDQLRFSQDIDESHTTLGMFLWGSTWSRIDKDSRNHLRDNTVLELRPMTFDLTRQQKVDILGAGVGDLRNIVALLLMLNRPSITSYVSVPKSRGWHKNRVLPFMSHTSVHVSLDAVSKMRLVGTPDGESVERRRHEVRGHFCHDQTARDYSRIAGCIHEFQPTHDDWTPAGDVHPDEVNNWVCASCGGKRWWRRAHERGSAEVGFVAHDGYEVEAA